MSFSRKELLSSTTGLTLLSSARLFALDPISRINPKLKGLSLATYSLKKQMKWFKGKKGKGKMTMLDFLDFAAKHQFDAVELTAYFFEEPVEKRTINQIKQRAHLLGLDLSSGAIGNNFCHDPSSEIGKQQMEYVKKWIDHYADLGIPVIRIFAGRYPAGMSEELALKNVMTNLQEALRYAEERGIILGIENHDSMTDIDKLIDFIKKVDAPNFGVTWDSANIATTDDPYRELEKLAPYSVNAQVKVKIPQADKKVDTDLARIVDILNRANYAGYLVLEYEEKQDPFTEIPRYKKILDTLI